MGSEGLNDAVLWVHVPWTLKARRGQKLLPGLRLERLDTPDEPIWSLQINRRLLEQTGSYHFALGARS